NPRAAKHFAGKHDFGVPETGRERDREYVSEEIKANDPGGMPEHSGSDAARTSGVGGNQSGVGSSSGGDVDTDIIGVGTGGTTIAQAGPDERTDGPDIVRAGQSPSDPFASKPPPDRPNAKRDPNRRRSTPKNRRERVRGTTVDRSGGDIT